MSCTDSAAHEVAERMSRYLGRDVIHEESEGKHKLSVHGFPDARCVVCADRLDPYSWRGYALGRYVFFLCPSDFCGRLVAHLARFATSVRYACWFWRLVLSIATVWTIFNIRGKHRGSTL